jgi:hypothetical protein
MKSKLAGAAILYVALSIGVFAAGFIGTLIGTLTNAL